MLFTGRMPTPLRSRCKPGLRSSDFTTVLAVYFEMDICDLLLQYFMNICFTTVLDEQYSLIEDTIASLMI
jgi:hypothetical protein